MKISGFTFIRNGDILGYPYLQSIQSALPLCDEFIIVVGLGNDNTLKNIQALQSKEPKIKIVETTWNESMQDRGFVYAQQKMIAQYSCTGDWVLYIECDELLHENDLDHLRNRITDIHEDSSIEALVFDYYHFFGSPQWIAVSPGWYRRAPRLLRNNLRSFAPDGLFWIVMDKNRRGRYPKSVLAETPIYHYGHVRKMEFMSKKIAQVGKYWGQANTFHAYDIDPQALAPFKGKHPNIILDWLASDAEACFQPNSKHVLTNRERKHRWIMKLEQLFKLELSKKHYQLIKG